MPPENNDEISKSKKALKDYINQNGFFFHITCDKIGAEEIGRIMENSSMVKTGKEIPTEGNIVVFKGIASQNYAKGEKSRNGYKYDQNGWDFSSYMSNPIILWQHNAQFGGIGNAVSFWNDAKGNLNALFFVDLDTLEERNAVQVRKGYVTAISTGAIAKEYMFEDNDTGERYTEAEAEEKFGGWNVLLAYWGENKNLTLVVTKAEMIENSLVTIGSNENAIAMQNAIGQHFKARANEYEAKIKKDNPVNKADMQTKVDEAEAESDAVLAGEEAQVAEDEEAGEETPSDGVEKREEAPAPDEQSGDEAESVPVSDAKPEESKEAPKKEEPKSNSVEVKVKMDDEFKSAIDSAVKTVSDSFEKRIDEIEKNHAEAIELLTKAITSTNANVSVVVNALKGERRSAGLAYSETDAPAKKQDAVSRAVRIAKTQ